MIQTYNQIIKNLSEDKYSKIYLLMGDQTFFIKKISQFFEKISLTIKIKVLIKK